MTVCRYLGREWRLLPINPVGAVVDEAFELLRVVLHPLANDTLRREDVNVHVSMYLALLNEIIPEGSETINGFNGDTLADLCYQGVQPSFQEYDACVRIDDTPNVREWLQGRYVNESDRDRTRIRGCWRTWIQNGYRVSISMDARTSVRRGKHDARPHTHAILVSAVAHLGERLLPIPPERVPRELATVLLMWEVITLAVALLPTLPVVNELLFSCVLILGVVHPTQVDAIVQTHVVPRMTRRPIVGMTYDASLPFQRRRRRTAWPRRGMSWAGSDRSRWRVAPDRNALIVS